MRVKKVTFGAMAAAMLIAAPGESQVPVANLTYADVADFALAGPVAAHVRLKRAVTLKPAAAIGLPPGKSRFYVEAETLSVLGGPQLPPKVSYLVDLPNDFSGKPVKLAKKGEYLISAAFAPGGPAQLRLTAPDAQFAWSPQLAERVRSVLAEAAAPGAPARITGIGRAFNVPGSLPGEGETQIFLQTADDRPVSLNISRSPGEEPTLGIALSEIVDDAVPPPRPDSLLWYRLACTLPATLPAQSFADANLARMTSIQADYRLVLNKLGPCPRSRPRA